MLCYNCFKETDSPGPCPYCGHDMLKNDEEYSVALKHGSILNGRYITGKVLNHNSFGITYLALDYKTKERIIIKEYMPSGNACRAAEQGPAVLNSEDAETFRRNKQRLVEEAKILSKLSDRNNICRPFCCFEENGTAYLAAEYAEGVTLGLYMAGHGGKLTVKEADDIFLPLMDTLESVHSNGMIHGDPSPDNILITGDGTAKLLNFGILNAGPNNPGIDGGAGMVIKYGFAPLEKYAGHGIKGPYTDIYIIAASYYYSVTGETLPNAIERTKEDKVIPPSMFGVEITPQAEDALMKALSVQAVDRFRRMREFKEILEQNEAVEPIDEEIVYASPAWFEDTDEDNIDRPHPLNNTLQDEVGHTVVICSSCGNEFLPGDRFCRQCGAKNRTAFGMNVNSGRLSVHNRIKIPES